VSRRFEEPVPLSILDGSDGDLIVTFDYSPGTPATGLSGPPENYDPGEGPMVEVVSTSYDVGPLCGLAAHEIEKVEEWLAENFEPPEDGPDADDLRDRAIDDRLTGLDQ
jgi:hypothetical protein